MHKNGHFFSHPKMIISFLTVCLSKMSSILVGGTLMHNCKILASIPQVGIYLHCAKAVELFFPFFPMAHHETNLQRQGHVAIWFTKNAPHRIIRGGGSGWVKSGVGGSKVGWVGLVQDILPPLINEA